MNRSTRFARLRVVIASSLLVGAVSTAVVSPARAVTLYTAALSADQVVPGPGDADAIGGISSISLRIDPDEPPGGRVCVGWEITGMAPATSAEIGIGAPGEAGAIHVAVPPPDEEGNGFDCARDLEPAIVQAILDDPAGFFVQVRNDEFPDGALRGQIQVSQVIRVSVAEFVCPGSVRTAADVLAAPQGTCTVAARTGDIGNPPAGFTWNPKPTLFDMQVNVTTGGGVLTLNDAFADGGGTCSGKTCSIFSWPYVWQDLTPGPMTVTAVNAPKGYKFGWATIGSTTEGQTAPAGTVNVAQHSISFDTTAFGANDGVFIAIYHFRGH
jgi:hypothetical protein